MKKIFLFVMLLCVSMLGYSQKWNGLKSNSPTTIQKSLVSSSSDEIVVDIKVDGYYSAKVNTPKGEQLVISGDDMASMLVEGMPNLPVYPISMIIDDNAEMEVTVIKSEYTDIEGVEVAPSKGNLKRKVNPDDVEYVYGDVYQQDAFYPAQAASLESPYILRDFRGQNIMVYPYAYNPVTKTLRVYTHMVVSAKKVSDKGENRKVSLRKTRTVIDPEVKSSYERRFINYEDKKTRDFIVDEGEMLVVCVDEYLDELQTLVEWKNISGRPTKIVAVSETGTKDQLKSYLSNYYQENPDLTYVLLVGEYNNLPPYLVGNDIYGSQESDNYYGMLEGNDRYEEVIVGRLPVANAADAVVQVNKIIYYERDIDEEDTWLSRASGVAANEGKGHYDEIDYQHIDFVCDTLMGYTYTDVTKHYAGVNNPNASGMVNDFSKGVGIINYCNHGYPTGWSVADFNTGHVHQMTNDNKLPVVWSVACNNGQFNVEECFGESWMRAANASTGLATGGIGGMFSWIAQPWIPPMHGQDEMVAILTEWRPNYKHTLGGASMNGSMYMLDACPDDEGITHSTWLLFGDPSMMMRTKAPESMDVSYTPSTLLVGMSSLVVKADTEFGIATLSIDGEPIASSYIENGKATLTFPEFTKVGKAKLVVIGYNKVTEVMDINVSPAEGAYLICTGYDLNDDNDKLDYNETIDLSLMVKNIGGVAINDVKVELSTQSEYVSVLDNEATIKALPSKLTATINKGFKIAVSPSVPDQTIIPFEVKCTSASETWTSEINIMANAPIFVIDNVSVLSDNSVLHPGDNATLRFDITNDGNSSATDVMTEIFSSSDDIAFEISTIKQESVDAGESFVVTADFTVSTATENGYSYEIAYSVFSGNYITDSTFFINIGSVFEDFESAGFDSYDWETGGSAPWTISGGAYEGNYCAKSGKIGDKQYSSMYLVMEVPSAGELSFYRKVSCEWKFDSLLFMIDGKAIDGWHDFVDWGQVSYTLPAGTHTIEWRYDKDPADSGKDDCGYIDNITLPPFNIVTSLASVQNLEVEVEETTVTLSWDANTNADEYIIKRDGVEVAVQSETTFTETLSKGVYTYSVVARNGKNYSLPAFVVANVDMVSVDEIATMTDVNVYPNPTTGVINVNIDTNFDAVIYNYQGQIVMKLNNNERQIDLSGLAAGIYFVEIRTDDNAVVKKIMLR